MMTLEHALELMAYHVTAMLETPNDATFRASIADDCQVEIAIDDRGICTCNGKTVGNRHGAARAIARCYAPAVAALA